MTDDEPQGARERVGFDPAVARWVVLAMLGLAIGGFVAFRLLSTPVPPPSPEVARDSFLMQGRAFFLSRCVPVTACLARETARWPHGFWARRWATSPTRNGNTATNRNTF